MKFFLSIILGIAFLNFGNTQCNTISNFLGTDVNFCQGEQSDFNVPVGYNFFSWSTGSTNSSVSIAQDTELILTLSELSTDLVINGDFELGDQDFTSQYVYGTGGSWGNLIFESDASNSNWDSLYKNIVAIEGTCFYIFKGASKIDEVFKQKEFFQLLR